MGNHEFCEDCHINNFHHGEPCDPTKKAIVELEKLERANRKKWQRERMEEICTNLKLQGLPAHFDRDLHAVVIRGYDLNL